MLKTENLCFLLVMIFLLASTTLVAETSIKDVVLREIDHVSFPANTQMGEMVGTLSVCHLMSQFGPDTSLYIATAYEKEFPASIDHIIVNAHSPIMERKGNNVFILYTSGVNTTCVTTYSVESGAAVFRSTETIAWNDGGYYRKSDNFPKYENLLIKRNHITSPEY